MPRESVTLCITCHWRFRLPIGVKTAKRLSNALEEMLSGVSIAVRPNAKKSTKTASVPGVADPL